MSSGTAIPLAGNNALNNFNGDTNPLGTVHNEAVDWTSVGSLSGLSIFLGYADNAHSGTCADADRQLSSPRIRGRDRPVHDSTGAAGGPGGCVKPGVTACFDAGAIRITGVVAGQRPCYSSVPGCVGAAAWQRRKFMTR